MMAAIVETLGAIRLDQKGLRSSKAGLAILEAGAGTGKTLAYLLAASPFAHELNKKLIVSTATVALQHQLMEKDLPDLKQVTERPLKCALAKGQNRYCCVRRLNDHVSKHPVTAAFPGLKQQFSAKPEDKENLYIDMLTQFNDGRWTGDLDSWSKKAILADSWQPIAFNRGDCTANRCNFYSSCPYFKARSQARNADIIITNHDLLITDLAMGGGILLPAPTESIYVIDEGHWMLERALTHLADELNISATHGWLTDMQGTLLKLSKGSPKDTLLQQLTTKYEESAEALRDGLNSMQKFIQQQFDDKMDANGLRFAHGVLPLGLSDIVKLIKEQADSVQQVIERTQQHTQDIVDGSANEAAHANQAKNYLPAINLLKAELSETWRLLHDYAHAPVVNVNAENEEEQPAKAATVNDVQGRWLSKDKPTQAGYTLHSSPATSGCFLEKQFWSKACGAIVTSATLKALGSFDFFKLHSGMPEWAFVGEFLSPFEFAKNSVLTVPAEAESAGNKKATALHTNSLVQLLPHLIKPGTGTLVLYSSISQLRQVRSELPKNLQQNVLAQNDYSPFEVLKRHQKLIDAGQTSVLFGLASFAKGIDLPGAYCRHVIIAKLPFPVPTEPIFATLAEWFEASGVNSFQKLSLPMASMRLVQAVGRLLRNETDSGQITLLDKRILTKSYGAVLLKALPPVARQIGKSCLSTDGHPWQ